MPLGGASAQAIITPQRRTRVFFDTPGTVIVEQPFALQRSGKEIARAQVPGHPNQHVQLLNTGAWCLEFETDRLDEQVEKGDPNSGVLRKPDFETTPNIVEKAFYRQQTDLPGVTTGAGAGMVATGHYFLTTKTVAGQSFAQSLDADIAAYGQPTPDWTGSKIDRVGVGNIVLPADQPLYFQWRFPGPAHHVASTCERLYFGGATTPYGDGQYALTVASNGFAYLHERVSETAHGSQAWEEVKRWRFSPSMVGGQIVIMKIVPHGISRGGYITFTSHVGTESTGGQHDISGKIVNKPEPHVTIYHVRQRAGVNRPNVTGAGAVRQDRSRGSSGMTQIQAPPVAQTGLLVDAPFSLPGYPTTRSDIHLLWRADVPTDTSCVGKLYDAETHAELTEVSRTDNEAVYSFPYGRNLFYATFEFTSDTARKKTPLLWTFAVIKDGITDTSTNEEWECNFVADEVSITQGEMDPSHETASFTIRDLTDEAVLLRIRAGMPVRIETQYSNADTSLRSVLFEGRVHRAPARKRRAYPDQIYPSPDSHDYTVECVGLYTRLNRQLTMIRKALGDDGSPRSENEPAVPFKVTDVIRLFLSYCGYEAGDIDVPDNPIRFWPNGDPDALMITPLSAVGPMILRWIVEYLGWRLVRDPNAGTRGMWRAIPPPSSPYSNLAAFVTDPGLTGPKAVLHPSSYGNTNWTGSSVTLPCTRLNTWVSPPEANVVTVIGLGPGGDGEKSNGQAKRTRVNYKSLDFYADSDGNINRSGDPGHPDYMDGELIPLVVVDGGLVFDPLTGTDPIQWACDRYFDVACHAIKHISVEAPLALIDDPADTNQTKLRPLRYYDPVTIDGNQALVKNVTITYMKDHLQMAEYELAAFVGDQTELII